MTTRRPRASGLGASVRRDLAPVPTALGLGAGATIVVALTGWWAVPLVGASLVAMGLVVALAVRKIGGLAGDVLGAVEQVVECTVLVVVSGLALHHQLWWVG
ncbi:MAG: adenosylcobinamide-GDP ribazoletransferase [Ilumatobacteraceae bacterium]